MLSVTQTTDHFAIVDAAGTLTAGDYDRFEAELDELARQRDELNLLIRLTDFHGWKPKALWQDVKLDLAYGDQLDRVAVVGRADWQDWMTRLADPFMDADVRYFDKSEAPGAVGWLLASRQAAT